VVAGSGVRWNPEGPGALRDALDTLDPDARRRVRLLGYVSEARKVSLLQRAIALAYPSLYEGFGLPVLEAMSCGTPVLTSSVSALPEVTGHAALLVDPTDTDAIGHGLLRLLTDQGLRDRLRAAGPERASGFTWEAAARRTAEVLHAASGG
jgi:glycosyltransferase involved in cell wall biosynthesis